MDSTAEGVVACVADAGATFLAPIFDELAAIVCLSGTPQSHIGIVSREYQVPCVMSAVFNGDQPADGLFHLAHVTDVGDKGEGVTAGLVELVGELLDFLGGVGEQADSDAADA